MKKILLLIAVLIGLLVMIDFTILNDKVDKSERRDTYEVIDPETIELGLDEKEKAPSFKIQTLAGESVTLEDYRGKKILLNFWATWCPPCKEEMPYMQQFYEEYADEDYVVLAVNVTPSEKSKEDVASFIEEYALTFPVLMDEEGEITHQYEILSYPTSYFIDSHGVIRKKIVGGMSKDMILREMLLLP